MAWRQEQKVFRKKMVSFIFTAQEERGQDSKGNLLVENLKVTSSHPYMICILQANVLNPMLMSPISAGQIHM